MVTNPHVTLQFLFLPRRDSRDDEAMCAVGDFEWILGFVGFHPDVRWSTDPIVGGERLTLGSDATCPVEISGVG